MSTGGITPPHQPSVNTASNGDSSVEETSGHTTISPQKQIPRARGKTPNTTLAHRTASPVNIPPELNAHAQKKRQLINTHQQAHQQHAGLIDQKAVLTHLPALHQQLLSGTKPSNLPYNVVFVADNGERTGVIPPDQSLKEQPEKETFLKNQLKAEVASLEKHFTPERQIALNEQLEKMDQLLAVCSVELEAFGIQAPPPNLQPRSAYLDIELLTGFPRSKPEEPRSSSRPKTNDDQHFLLSPQQKAEALDAAPDIKVAAPALQPSRLKNTGDLSKEWLAFYCDGNKTIPKQLWTLNKIRSFSEEQLEDEHSYIQLLFPNTEPSKVNKEAPILTPAMIHQVRNSSELQQEVEKSLDTMLGFWGLKRKGNAIEVIPNSPRQHQKWCLDDNNHNHLRVSRVLYFLKDCGYGTCALNLESKLNEHRTRNGIPVNPHWLKAVGKPVHERQPPIATAATRASAIRASATRTSATRTSATRTSATRTSTTRPPTRVRQNTSSNPERAIKSYKDYMTEFPYSACRNKSKIMFYDRMKPNYEFTNFYTPPKPLLIDGHHWKTTEHYFQACKFTVDSPDWKNIQSLPTARLVYDYLHPPGKPSLLISMTYLEWNKIKDQVMLHAIRAKAEQDSTFSESLLKTGNLPLFEDSPKDSYWGIGESKAGENRLGAMLMQIRDELRAGRRLEE